MESFLIGGKGDIHGCSFAILTECTYVQPVLIFSRSLDPKWENKNCFSELGYSV